MKHWTLVMSPRPRGPFHMTIEWCESPLATPTPVGLALPSVGQSKEALTATVMVIKIATRLR